jgi:hypothetical protein
MKAIKAVTRVVGGITGKGGKSVNPTYAESRANKRGLKAANKPTNKTGSKQDRADRNFYQDKSNFIKNSDPLRPNRVRGGSLGAMKKYGDLGVATAKLSPKQAAFRKEVTEDLNKKRRGR